MRVLVTGSAGFIAFHLVQRLLAEGHEVVGVDNFVTGQQQNYEDLCGDKGFSFIEQDICEPLKVDGPIDVVFDLACPPSPVDFEGKSLEILRTCSEGVRNVLELVKEKSCILVHASTSECYGDPDVHPQPETYWGNVNPLGPRAPYDEGKRFAEALIMAYYRKYALQTRMARIFNTYGPRMRTGDGRVLPAFIGQALSNTPITVYGRGEQTRSFCYVADLVEGLIRLSHTDFAEPINVGNDEEVTILEVAKEIIELAGSQSEIIFKPLPQDDPKRRKPDLTRAKKMLDWSPSTKRRVGFKSTIEYFRSLSGK